MHICALFASVLWALGYVLTRIAVLDFSSDVLGFLRYFTAALALIIYAAIKKIRWPEKKDIPIFIVGGAIGFAIYVYTINEGSRTLYAGTVSFIISATPVLTAFLAYLFFREKIGLRGWISIACAFSGVAFITYFSGGFALSSGIVWVCIAMILFGFYNILQRNLLRRYSPLEITTYCIIIGAILLSVFAPRAFTQLAAASASGIVSVLFLGLFSGSGAYLLWAYALHHAEKTSEATNYMFLTPILTTLFGFVIIKEAPHFSVYVGGILVLLGVMLAVHNANKLSNER